MVFSFPSPPPHTPSLRLCYLWQIQFFSAQLREPEREGNFFLSTCTYTNLSERFWLVQTATQCPSFSQSLWLREWGNTIGQIWITCGPCGQWISRPMRTAWSEGLTVPQGKVTKRMGKGMLRRILPSPKMTSTTALVLTWHMVLGQLFNNNIIIVTLCCTLTTYQIMCQYSVT